MSKANVNYVRVLPQDSINRVIFEAEQKLTKSLKKERKPTKAKRKLSVPILKQPSAFTDGKGILSRRQKIWADANPNEPHVENPTYLRNLILDEKEKTTKTESFYEAQEVRGLPDVKHVEPGHGSVKTTSVVQKISEGRKERHHVTMDEFHEKLGVISSEIEPRIVEASEIFKESFFANDEELSKVTQLYSDDKDLVKYSLKDLYKLWDCITEICSSRKEYVTELEKTFHAIEQDRYEMLCETFKSFNAKLEHIAFLMPSDVHRLMESEAEEINATIICNRKSYADLIATLHKDVVELERKHHHVWEKRLKTWKKLKTNEAIEEFVDYMNNDEVRHPLEVSRCVEEMREAQNSLNEKRLELLNSLREMKPPGSTKAAVYQWNNALGHLTLQIDKTNKKYMERLQNAYEEVLENCNEKLEKTKSRLENDNIIGGEELIAILNESFLPLIGEKKSRYECEMDIFEKTVENTAIHQDDLLRSLFRFLQGAAHIWDTHEIGMARQERALQEKLEQERHRHDAANQVKEANLDIIMDKMRQESSQEALEKSLIRALSLLDEIEEGYKIFHSTQLECVCKYPDKIKAQLNIYDREICAFFAVYRNKPQPNKKRRASITPDSPRQNRASLETSPNSLEEILKTSNGTTFYIITSPGDYSFPVSSASVRSMKTSMTFLTDAPGMDDNGDIYADKLIIQDELILELRQQLRVQFLESLEKWKIDAMERANSIVAAKAEELNSELDLRLHLHKPRPSRAEQDVHNVRAAELVIHQERVESHSKGISCTLNEFRSRFQTMIEEHNEQTVKFKKSVQELEATFTSATKTHELLAIQDHVSGQVETYMNEIRSSLRKFRHDLDGMLSSLRNSNARFRKSFKVFSEGGNFSLEEVEEYRKKLERLANKIDVAEGTIMGELEGMESKRLEAALEYAGKLEDRFKYHLFDLTFMEKFTRWITNSQVKIKTEVSQSNAQSKNLITSLGKVERYIDAVRNPNLDKEQVTCDDVVDELRQVFRQFVDRAVYLDCLLVDQDACYAALKDRELPYVDEEQESKGKKSRKDGRRSRSFSKSIRRSSQTEKSTTPSKLPVIESDNQSAPDHTSNTMPPDMEKRTSSQPTTKQSTQSMSQRNFRSNTIRRSSVLKKDAFAKYERKYMVFGEKFDKEPKTDFLSIIQQILKYSLDGLLTTGEAYYRQKGTRLATRSTILDNFDVYAQTTVLRLKSYRTQAEEYHNSCIQELRSQLKRLQMLAVQMAELAHQTLKRRHMEENEIYKKKMEQREKETVASFENQRKEHEHRLRPALGHPKNREQLEELKDAEKERSALKLKALKDYIDEVKSNAILRAKTFVEKVSRTGAEMSRLFDGLVTVDDVKIAKVGDKPKSTKQILLERAKPPKDEQEKESEFYSKPGGKWEGIPTNELRFSPQDVLTRTPSVLTSKITAAHHSVFNARDEAYKDYKAQFFAHVNEINNYGENASHEEERWQEKWRFSLQRIQNLH
ncbi:coiled-coil domain-containing protein 180-like [Xenia sp. Carnegie-2017]|uniref:coiled-coil domain-containing protein 180-like n=1 Tax=Xenia sp. Carnegie-2017 TaxID=2897299 RepID=UPI001F0340AF|nr:coiled-coil domain-containing protein 180-like [Xenia sp. Carnegie-2017]